MSATTETATLTISTRAANPDDGHTAAEDRQWDRIRAAAGRCGVRLCGSDWSEDGRRETNRVEGDARAVRKHGANRLPRPRLELVSA